jgi:hypothetical protein
MRCGLKRKVVTGDWKKLHNEELHNSYSSSNIIKMMKSRWMSEACSTNGRDDNCT